jgi:two-component system alkaline phosphatase synthesis response regulator PhoP
MAKIKVMIVDDEQDFLRMVKLNLEDTGKFEVLTLLGANEVIPKLHIFKPNLIILDMVMPGIGGIEICDMLNKDTLGKTLPILILSALDKDKDKLAAYKKGVVGYLTKPIEKNTLITKIENALHARIPE